MSEYQYYEFVAIDHPLTDAQVEEVQRFSTRAEITSTRFTNEYNYGDFGGDPAEFLAKWYDAMVYYANWGSQQLMLRVRADLIDPKLAKAYCAGRNASAKLAGEHLIFDFSYNSDGGDGRYWDGSAASPMAKLIPLREELLRGDHRVLYLGWLLCVYELKDGVKEPPVPPGLGKLSKALKAFVDFLEIDEDLLAVAAEASPPASEPEGDMSEWILAMPSEKKDELLLAFCAGTDPHLAVKLQRDFHAQRAKDRNAGAAGHAPRTAGALREAAEQHRENRERDKKARLAGQMAHRKAEEAALREKHLDEMAGRKEDVWKEVELIASSKMRSMYDQAIALVVDLAAIAAREGTSLAFQARLAKLRERHARKRVFARRLEQVKLFSMRTT